MKRTIITWISILLPFFCLAQNRQHFNLFTDRDIYSSGETVLLKLLAPDSDPSQIAHLDLFNLQGNRVAGINLEIEGRQADGFIYLSDSLSSGCYLLRASSRATKISTFKEIYVANRFVNISELSSSIKQSEVVPVDEIPGKFMELDGIGDIYQTRQTGHFTVNLPADFMGSIDGDLMISIAEESLSYPAKTFLMEASRKEKHLVEGEGMILEGLVTDKETGKPFKDAVVFFSISDSIPDFNYYLTGKDGRFYFQLKKYFGKIPIVLQCFDKENQRLLKISLSDPERWINELPPFEGKIFLPEFQKTIQKNRDAATYRKIFNQQQLAIHPSLQPKTDAYPFFGVPTNIVNPKLFTDLSDFSEISRELLPGVKYRTYNRIPTMQVINTAMHAFSNELPLVLLDGIPVRDLNLIKDLGTKDIDEIELCLNERFYGKLSFKGVVSIHSSRKDLTRIPGSDELIKLNLDAIQNRCDLVVPTGKPANEPDFRQVLLWEPRVRPMQMVNVNFQTSDIRGRFKLIVQCKTKVNEVIRKEQIFEVK